MICIDAIFAGRHNLLVHRREVHGRRHNRVAFDWSNLQHPGPSPLVVDPAKLLEPWLHRVDDSIRGFFRAVADAGVDLAHRAGRRSGCRGPDPRDAEPTGSVATRPGAFEQSELTSARASNR